MMKPPYFRTIDGHCYMLFEEHEFLHASLTRLLDGHIRDNLRLETENREMQKEITRLRRIERRARKRWLESQEVNSDEQNAQPDGGESTESDDCTWRPSSSQE